MTDTNNTAAETAAKTVLTDMDSRKVFPTAEEALAYITERSQSLSDFGEHPLVIAGLDDDDQFDPAVYNDSMDVAVSVLTKKGNKAENIESSVIAIVVFPCPKLDAVLADSTASEWLVEIMRKEFNHVAVRNLRKAESAEDLEEARKGMPCSIADYTTSQRETSGGILEVYNTLWQQIKKAVGTKFKAFAIANLSKKELRKGIESTSYAANTYPTLENRTTKAGDPFSLFVLAATLGVALAKEKGLDPSFFEKALANRDTKVIDVNDEGDDEFDLDALMSAATKAEPATPATDEPAPAAE